MNRKKTVLRDFIYLDEERLRSLAAQLFRGVPESATEERSDEVTTKAEAEVGLWSVLKAKLGLDYRYLKSEDQTRTLHHYVYSLFEMQLEKEGLLTEIDADFDFNQWTEDFFHDGQFIKVKGLVRFMDYEWISGMLEALPKMMETVYHFVNRALKSELDEDEISRERYDAQIHKQKTQLKEIKGWKLEKLTELIRDLYADVTRIKVLPSREHLDKIFVGSGEGENFYDTTASLAQKYGYEVDAGWITVGQINISTVSEQALPLPIGNAMEDGFEQVVFGLNELIRVASSPQFPAVSFTPISIYRMSTP